MDKPNVCHVIGVKPRIKPSYWRDESEINVRQSKCNVIACNVFAKKVQGIAIIAVLYLATYVYNTRFLV